VPISRSGLRRIVLAICVVTLAGALAAAGALHFFFSGDGVRRALEQQASAWLGHPVRIGTVNGQLLPRPGIRLRNVTVGEPATLTLASIQVSTDLRAILGRRIENAELVVSNSRVEMPLPFSRSATQPAASGGAGSIRLVSVRSIALDDVRLVSRGREIVVDGDSALDATRLTVRRFTASSGDTTMEVEGVVELGDRLDATMRVRANLLDVDELLALADAFTPASGGRQQQAQRPMRIAARVSAERARAGGVDVDQFATEMQVEGDRVTLSPLTFQLFGGRYQGALRARLGSAVEAALDSRITDLDVARLAAFGDVPDAITGTLSGAGNFSGRGADLAAVLKDASGEGTASIVDGTIRRLNLIRTVVLFFGRPAPEAAAATDAFKRLDLRFSLNDGVASAQAFALQSDDADIVGSGTLNTRTKKLDGRLDLSLSEELSARAGTDLRRYTREGNRVVLPATIGGSLGEPRLRIDAAAALKRGLRNEIQERLGGLLDRFQR
jgi:uncharacterized protein involved in outer membrane biogenesis